MHPLSRPLAAAALALVACDGSHPASPEDQEPRPDVVLAVVDTLRADRLEPYGYERPTSPHLARIASEGVVFEDVTAQGSWTKPSMVSLLQGRYLTDYRDIPLEDSPTLAEVFRGAGYRTLGVVGNALLSEEDGFARGFELYDHVRSSDRGRGQKPSRSGEELLAAAEELLPRAFEPEADGTRPPVLVWFHLMEPHAPYERYPEYEPELAAHVSILDGRREYFRRLTGRDPPLQDWTRLAQELAAYDQEVRAADHWIDRLLAEVGELGDLRNTLVAVVSDHGEGLWQRPRPPEARPSDQDGEEARRLAPAEVQGLGPHTPDAHLFGRHGNVIDRNLVATPMILRGPGVPAGMRVDVPVSNVDLFPTLLDLCGVERPAELHGRSLVPVLSGEVPSEPTLYSRVLKEKAVREPEGRWRLVMPTEHGSGVREVRLHDLRADPLERVDLTEEHPDVVARLRSLLERIEERYPTASSLGRERSRAERQDLKALGYLGEDD